jgi:hypothetical protein
MTPDLAEALRRLLAMYDEGELFDREEPEGAYASQELEDVIAVVRRHLRDLRD